MSTVATVVLLADGYDEDDPLFLIIDKWMDRNHNGTRFTNVGEYVDMTKNSHKSMEREIYICAINGFWEEEFIAMLKKLRLKRPLQVSCSTHEQDGFTNYVIQDKWVD